jgi:MoxR-like ATPase
MNELRTRFSTLREVLTDRHIERYDEVEIALVALLAKYHVALIGPPGTAKSMLAADLSKAFGGTFFELDVMSKFTTPEELFGPLDVSKLEDGVYERVIEGSIVEADIAFLDEAFKASPAILNKMLRLMNEREYKHGRNIIKVPLKTMFVASNELPEGEELWAMFDRFQFRKVVNYINEPSNFIKMMKSPATVELPKITLEELIAAQELVDAVQTPDPVYDTLYNLRADMQLDGIHVSDRRFKQSVNALKAMCWLDGRDVVTDDDFRILQHMMWTNPVEAKKVSRIVLRHTNPLEMAADEIIDMADEIAGQLSAALMDARQKDVDPQQALTTQGIDWFTRCRQLADEVKELEIKAKRQSKATNRISQARDRVKRVAKEVARHTMGLEDMVQ